ncbi:caspase family protein [Calothrix sp. 336/3]|uniref:caspase family protein n=1 Tax=Calothrix sp. 336/3 TaxID=1337936 RepID=UPI0004E3ABAD|nr:caspase family protein [Calothrix sp. 336/3]AKG22813.1 peptidase C14 [Calothrix sp. 336/3]
MKRRRFFQHFGSILALLGASEAGWFTWESGYLPALAESSPRKLALLVGINQYSHGGTLGGCLTDVELQRELLIHRFGFIGSDILTLTDGAASRESLESAFVEHLSKQAQPGDVVFFHFSGYGSYVKSDTAADSLLKALIPADGIEIKAGQQEANYLLEETLFLMLRSLSTDKITAILDTSYNSLSQYLPAELITRSYQTPATAIFTNTELELRKQLPEKATQEALILQATAAPGQQAREIQLSGMNAGLFTYALTQYLWEITPATTIQFCLSQINSSIQQIGGNQESSWLSTKKNQQRALLTENLLPKTDIGAEAIITAVEDEGKTVQLSLAGIPPQVLESYGVNSRLRLVQPGDGELILRSRTGLTAKAQVTNSQTMPKIGNLAQETVRIIPRNINLTVALDSKLARIERVDATSAFANIERVSSVVIGEQTADYVFAKQPTSQDKELINNSASRYSLFSLSGERLPNTLGEAGEAVKVAVQRLAPKLQTFLGAKLWRLTENAASSQLQVKATLEVINGISPRGIMQRQTWRSRTWENGNKKLNNPDSTAIPEISIGSRVQYRVQNFGDRPLYVTLVGLNSARMAIALYPWQTEKTPENPQNPSQIQDVVIPPGQTITIPQTPSGFEWVIQSPTFWCETQLIFSTAPFTQTTTALSNYPHGEQQRIFPLLNPLEVAQAILQDLHNASTATVDTNNIPGDSYLWDVNHWASLGFMFQVVS